jgi:hypothetical protein
MHRYTPLIVLALVLSGCAGGVSPSTPTESPSEGPEEDFDQPFPEPLDTVSSDTVQEFAIQYEKALMYRKHDRPSTTDITFVPQDINVTERSDGFLVEIHYNLGIVEETSEGEVVSDLEFTANYWVNGSTVRRTRVGGVSSPPDPQTNGTEATAYETATS